MSDVDKSDSGTNTPTGDQAREDEIDIRALAEAVFALLKKELRIERERRVGR